MSITRVVLEEGFRTDISTRDHFYHADEPEDNGGSDTAVTPVEMLLGALGSCLAMTMKMYAQRKGWPLESVEIQLEQERFSGKDHPTYEGDAPIIHEIRKHIILTGDLTDEQRQKIVEIGGKCPVHRLIDTPTMWVEKLAD